MRHRSVLFLCLLGCVAVFAAPAQSDTILGCGSVVTESLVLQNDIGPCAADGLIVQGGTATIDLNGHTISGSAGSGFGVRIAASETLPIADVRLSNGTIEGFGGGVSIVAAGSQACSSSSVITVDQLVVRANGSGISAFVTCGAAVNVTRNLVEENAGDGIWGGVGNSGGAIHILDNRVVGNTGTGIKGIFDSVRRVEGNFVARNGKDGIYLEDTVASVKSNVMSRNGGVGLVIRETSPSFIPLYVVANNVADGNAAGGMIASSFPDPPGPPAGSGNSAKQNGVFQCTLIKCAANAGQAKKG